jgi:hypothetical protein
VSTCEVRRELGSVRISMSNLALTYTNQGRWKEAEELFVQVIETSLRVLGKEHPDTLTSMANLHIRGTWPMLQCKLIIQRNGFHREILLYE